MNVTQCCPLTGCDNDPADLVHITTPAAGKDHECCECHETITKWSKHELYTAKDGKTWSSYRTCLSCVEIRDHFACNGWYFGMLWEDLEQNFFPTMKAGGPCMEGLSPAAKARLFERRLAWQEGRHA